MSTTNTITIKADEFVRGFNINGRTLNAYDALKHLCRPEGNFIRWTNKLKEIGRKDILASYTDISVSHIMEVYIDDKCNVCIAFIDNDMPWDQAWSYTVMEDGKFCLDKRNEGFASNVVRNWNRMTEYIGNIIRNLQDDNDSSIMGYRAYFSR